MSEKGDLGVPSDPNISLPPNYAPSEAFTDSPPPAYQRKNMPIIRIVRMVCMTVLAVTFLIGFFIVAHRWVLSGHQVMIHEQNVEQAPQSQFLTAKENEIVENLQDASAPLVQEASVVNLPIDNNRIENDIQLKGENLEPIYPIEAESSTENQENEFVPPEQMLPELPPPPPRGLLFPFQDQLNKINFPFPKPKGNCKVEKSIKNVGPGIQSESVVVVCKDEVEFNGEKQPMLPPPPPAFPIFPPTDSMEPPMPFNEFQSGPVDPPLSIIGAIMKVLASKKMNDLETPNGRPKMIKMIPLEGRPSIFPPAPIRGEPNEMPKPIAGPPKGLFPLMKLFPLGKIEIRAKNQKPDQDVEFLPFERRPMDGPFPLPPFEEEEFPKMRPAIKVIRINKPPIMREDENDVERLPFPFSPIMNLLPQGRQARVIRIRPKMNEEEQEAPSFPLPPFLFPHGHPEEPLPHPMPEASGRALPDPVNIPGKLKMLRLPFVPPQRFPFNPRVTHMELKQEPRKIQLPFHDSIKEFSLSPFQKVLNEIPTDQKHFPNTPDHEHNFSHDPNHNNHEHQLDEIDDFGPPRTHTLMQPPPQIFGEDEQNYNPINDPSFHPHEESPNFHVHEDGTAHSHPFNGPHTHIRGRIVPLPPQFPEQREPMGFPSENHQQTNFQPETPDFHMQDNQDNFFISEGHEQFPLENQEQLLPEVFDPQIIFDSIDNGEFAPIQTDIVPKESVYQSDQEIFDPQEEGFLPDGPIILPDILSSNPNEEAPEEPTETIDLFEELPVPEEQPNEAELTENDPQEVLLAPEEPTLIVEDEPEEPKEILPLDERGYDPNGRVAPNPPPIEDDAEMMTPEEVLPEESKALI